MNKYIKFEISIDNFVLEEIIENFTFESF